MTVPPTTTGQVGHSREALAKKLRAVRRNYRTLQRAYETSQLFARAVSGDLQSMRQQRDELHRQLTAKRHWTTALSDVMLALFAASLQIAGLVLIAEILIMFGRWIFR